MIKDKILRAMLFGKHEPLQKPSRSVQINFPNKEDGEVGRSILFPGDDGIFLYLVKRLERAEKRISDLESKESQKPKKS